MTAIETPDKLPAAPAARTLAGDIALAVGQLRRHARALRVLTEHSLIRSVSGQHLGFLWWFAEPLINALIFYFVVVLIFHRGGPDYHFTLITGLLCWQLFANTLNNVTTSLTSNSNFLLRGVFPPLVAAVAPVLSGLFLATCAFAVVLVFMPYPVGPTLLLLPLVLLIQVLLGLALGLPLAILNVLLPDTRRIIHFITRFGWFLSPILYPVGRVIDATGVPGWFKTIYLMNPIVHTINAMRYSFTGQAELPLYGLAICALAAVLMTLLGMGLIVRMQNAFMKRL